MLWTNEMYVRPLHIHVQYMSEMEMIFNEYALTASTLRYIVHSTTHNPFGANKSFSNLKFHKMYTEMLMDLILLWTIHVEHVNGRTSFHFVPNTSNKIPNEMSERASYVNPTPFKHTNIYETNVNRYCLP